MPKEELSGSMGLAVSGVFYSFYYGFRLPLPFELVQEIVLGPQAPVLAETVLMGRDFPVLERYGFGAGGVYRALGVGVPGGVLILPGWFSLFFS